MVVVVTRKGVIVRVINPVANVLSVLAVDVAVVTIAVAVLTIDVAVGVVDEPEDEQINSVLLAQSSTTVVPQPEMLGSHASVNFIW